jgi:hypothetical protein
MAIRSHDTKDAKVKDELKDLEDNNIDVSQLLKFKAEK